MRQVGCIKSAKIEHPGEILWSICLQILQSQVVEKRRYNISD